MIADQRIISGLRPSVFKNLRADILNEKNVRDSKLEQDRITEFVLT
jgi:hypothetical protein